MRNDRVVFNYTQASPISGLSDSTPTAIPGTSVKLPEGKYKITGTFRAAIVRGANDGQSQQITLAINVGGSVIFSPSSFIGMSAGTVGNYQASLSNTEVHELTSATVVYLQAYIAANGTVTSRNIDGASFVIEKLS